MIALWLWACLPTVWDHDGDGWTEAFGDCDDDDATIHPQAEEFCGDVDHDCDGTPGGADAVDAITYVLDLDGDAYPGSEVQACEPPSAEAVPVEELVEDPDCDDTDFSIHPGAEEVLGNGVDDDCDGTIDGSSSSAGWLYFASEGANGSQIWQTDLDLSEPEQLTSFANDGAPIEALRVTPDGSAIVFRRGGDWYRMTADGTLDSLADDDYQPDGAFAANSRWYYTVSAGSTVLVRLDLVTGETVLSDFDAPANAAEIWVLDAHPSGPDLLIHMNRPDPLPSGLFRWNPVTGDVFPLETIEVPLGKLMATWAPDYETLAYAVAGESEVTLLDEDGLGVGDLELDDGDFVTWNGRMDWDSTGESLYVPVDKGDKAELRRFQVDGTDVDQALSWPNIYHQQIALAWDRLPECDDPTNTVFAWLDGELIAELPMTPVDVADLEFGLAGADAFLDDIVLEADCEVQIDLDFDDGDTGCLGGSTYEGSFFPMAGQSYSCPFTLPSDSSSVLVRWKIKEKTDGGESSFNATVYVGDSENAVKVKVLGSGATGSAVVEDISGSMSTSFVFPDDEDWHELAISSYVLTFD